MKLKIIINDEEENIKYFFWWKILFTLNLEKLDADDLFMRSGAFSMNVPKFLKPEYFGCGLFTTLVEVYSYSSCIYGNNTDTIFYNYCIVDNNID